MEISEQVKQEIEDIASKAGYVIFDLKLINTHPLATLRVLIDSPSGGITIKECADINSKLRDSFQTQDSSQEQYTIEVFSPGMDWPLKEKRDFKRIVGSKVRLFLKEKQQDRFELEGVLNEVGEDSLILQVGQEGLKINLCNIDRAKEKY
ncbi:MAG: hypothetical protein KJ593_06600 [Candidatus Omnitrophica bacterium]|nr:hypothetical protein [Candidatus Omnitrophota bacterium]